MQQWTIIGGGIHAVTIALKLINLGLAQQQLTIIDPHNDLCEQFARRTSKISMPFLRSPGVHHVHPDPFHLKQFAKVNQYTNCTLGKYQRPQTNMFMDHIHMLIHQFDLNHSHISASAIELFPTDNQWSVLLDNNEIIKTKNVVLAFGSYHHTNVPQIFQQQPDVQHIFQDDDTINFCSSSHVVGSGISAAHLINKLLKQDERIVHLWLNKYLEVHDFDADPGWLGPKNMTYFEAIEDSQQRLLLLNKERHKGSLPRELYLKLKHYQEQGRLMIHHDKINDIRHHHIITDNNETYYDNIILATGFSNSLYQLPLIKNLILHYQAPMANCGLPLLTDQLSWLPNLYVSGALADLKLGPFARNIAGGREAAKRIGSAFNATSYTK